MTDETYNGWTNYETWNYKLWMDNDAGSYEYWRERAQAMSDCAVPAHKWESEMDAAIHDLAVDLESNCEEYLENWMGTQSGPFADLLNAAVGRIEWREIAESLLNDCDD